MSIPDPLHPLVVHFPVVLAVLVPLFAAAAILAIGRGVLPRSAWAAVVGLHLLLVASAWLAVETGESEEDRVEEVVAERHIEAHEEAAERFLLACGVALPLVGLGLLAGRRGQWARLAAVAVSLGVLGMGVPVGHSGGELVYRYGAPLAYATGEGAPGTAGTEAGWRLRGGGDSAPSASRSDSDSDS